LKKSFAEKNNKTEIINKEIKTDLFSII